MFLFRLALALGMTVKQLLQNIGARELEEWMAFYEIEPWGYVPEESRNAQIRCHMSNMMKDKKSTPLHFLDYVPPDHPIFASLKKQLAKRRKKPRQTTSDMKGILLAIHKGKNK